MDDPKLVECASGRRIAVQLSGDPNGRPVIFLHGTPSSRLFVPPEEVSRAEHALVVSLDRPGYGWSDAAPPDATIKTVAEDILSAVEHIPARMPVVGFSGGAPYALACAAVGRGIVTAVACVSGEAPLRLTPELSELSEDELELVKLARNDPSWGAAELMRHAEGFAHDPLFYVDRPVEGPDAAMRAGVRELLVSNAREAGRQGAAGLVGDWLREILPWGVVLGEIEQPVDVWYGSADPGPAPQAAPRLLRELPDAVEHRVADAGHELALTHWREILASLRPGTQRP